MGEQKIDIRNKTAITTFQTFDVLIIGCLTELKRRWSTSHRLIVLWRAIATRSIQKGTAPPRGPLTTPYQPQFNFITSTTFAFGTTGIFTAV
ncbi:hypothetical protein [Paraburkholderia acidicola]|uniref:hypothetical protein n=1 Tax=Paraburkholderia acidicola TaxID=1912599 RepID=UPI0012FF5B1B|nr:hypothetical protein [Paraburkholderia acidicola]